MVDISTFLKSERAAYERDPEKYKRERAEDARRAYKDFDRFEDQKLMERYERMQKHKEAKGKAKIPSEILIGRAIANARQEEESRKKTPKTEADSDNKRDSGKAKFVKPPSARGSAGGGGMNPTDVEKVPGKRQLKFKSGGSVSASKRADGCAVRGKTKGKMV